MRDDEEVGRLPAAEVRARLIRAARLFEAGLLAGHEDEESVEAEAGAILEAEAANDIHELRELASAWWEAWLKVHRK